MAKKPRPIDNKIFAIIFIFASPFYSVNSIIAQMNEKFNREKRGMVRIEKIKTKKRGKNQIHTR